MATWFHENWKFTIVVNVKFIISQICTTCEIREIKLLAKLTCSTSGIDHSMALNQLRIEIPMTSVMERITFTESLKIPNTLLCVLYFVKGKTWTRKARNQRRQAEFRQLPEYLHPCNFTWTINYYCSYNLKPRYDWKIIPFMIITKYTIIWNILTANNTQKITVRLMVQKYFHYIMLNFTKYLFSCLKRLPTQNWTRTLFKGIKLYLTIRGYCTPNKKLAYFMLYF